MTDDSKELSGLATVLFTNFENVANIRYTNEDAIKVIPKEEFDKDFVIQEIKRRVNELEEDSSYDYITEIKSDILHVYIKT